MDKRIEFEPYKGLTDIFCPFCCHSAGVRGQRTEIYHQYTHTCKHCKGVFTVSYFKAIEYTDIVRYRRDKGE